jgi:hypothetical protein
MHRKVCACACGHACALIHRVSCMHLRAHTYTRTPSHTQRDHRHNTHTQIHRLTRQRARLTVYDICCSGSRTLTSVPTHTGQGGSASTKHESAACIHGWTCALRARACMPLSMHACTWPVRTHTRTCTCIRTRIARPACTYPRQDLRTPSRSTRRKSMSRCARPARSRHRRRT